MSMAEMVFSKIDSVVKANAKSLIDVIREYKNEREQIKQILLEKDLDITEMTGSGEISEEQASLMAFATTFKIFEKKAKDWLQLGSKLEHQNLVIGAVYNSVKGMDEYAQLGEQARQEVKDFADDAIKKIRAYSKSLKEWYSQKDYL